MATVNRTGEQRVAAGVRNMAALIGELARLAKGAA